MVGRVGARAHVAQCLPEICTLDCGTMNFAEADYVMTNTPGMLTAMGQMMTDLGVKPEIEAFDTGHLWYAKQLVEDGVWTRLRWCNCAWACRGARRTTSIRSWRWSTMCRTTGRFRPFRLGRNQMAYVAAAVLAGGNVRVGLEDNLWLGKGDLAQNWQLVERAMTIIENMGARVIGPAEVREKLGLEKRAPKG